MLKLGSKVKMSNVGKDEYGPSPSNPWDVVGTIFEIGTGDNPSVRVLWSNGHKNIYSSRHLKLHYKVTGFKKFQERLSDVQVDESEGGGEGRKEAAHVNWTTYAVLGEPGLATPLWVTQTVPTWPPSPQADQPEPYDLEGILEDDDEEDHEFEWVDDEDDDF